MSVSVRKWCLDGAKQRLVRSWCHVVLVLFAFPVRNMTQLLLALGKALWEFGIERKHSPVIRERLSCSLHRVGNWALGRNENVQDWNFDSEPVDLSLPIPFKCNSSRPLLAISLSSRPRHFCCYSLLVEFVKEDFVVLLISGYFLLTDFHSHAGFSYTPLRFEDL